MRTLPSDDLLSSQNFVSVPPKPSGSPAPSAPAPKPVQVAPGILQHGNGALSTNLPLPGRITSAVAAMILRDDPVARIEAALAPEPEKAGFRVIANPAPPFYLDLTVLCGSQEARRALTFKLRNIRHSMGADRLTLRLSHQAEYHAFCEALNEVSARYLPGAHVPKMPPVESYWLLGTPKLEPVWPTFSLGLGL